MRREPIGYSEPDQLQKRLIAAASNPRDKAFIAVLARDGIRISEVSTPLSMTSAMGMARTYEDLH